MRRGNKGVTLVELMAAAVILAIIMIPVSAVLYSTYKNYFEENDTMVLQQRTREVMDQIVKDLRTYETKATAAQGDTLSIDQNNIYTYASGMLSKNNNPLFDASEGIEVTAFSAVDKSGNYDSGVIGISLSVKSQRGRELTVQNNYRRKIP